jgi:hypothetical protein
MARKLCAVSLIVLIVLPFTAPFTTCEQANAMAIGAAREDAAVAQAPVLQDDDAIVASEWTLAIQRLGPSVVSVGGPSLSISRLVQRPSRSSEPQPQTMHVCTSAILRV